MFAVFFALVAIRALTLSGAGTFRRHEWGEIKPASEVFFAAASYCLAEILSGKDSRYSSLSPRVEISRLFMSGGINGTGSYRTGSPAHTIMKHHIAVPKNSIPVNLRI